MGMVRNIMIKITKAGMELESNLYFDCMPDNSKLDSMTECFRQSPPYLAGTAVLVRS